MTVEERSTPSVLPCRLFAILAREAPRAVILRRGPSKWVQIILWHTGAAQGAVPSDVETHLVAVLHS